MACVVATVVMVIAGIIFYVAAVPLAAMFLKGQSEEVIPLAAHLLRIVAYAMAPLALLMVLVGALRGAGDTRWPLVLNLIGIVFFRVPLALFLAHSTIHIPFIDYTIQGAGWGVVGAWYAAVTDIVVRCVLLMLRFRHDAWQKIDV
jgi:Na+-driven multidrug efflux pump